MNKQHGRRCVQVFMAFAVAVGSLLGIVVSCGDRCPAPRSVDEALGQTCAVADAGPTDARPSDAGPDGTPASASCSPRMGTVCTAIGTGVAGLGMDNVPGIQTKLYLPMDVTIGPDKSVYVVDWNNHRIRAMDPTGVIRTVAGSGEISDGDSTPESMPSRAPEPALTHRLNHPTNVTFDPQGRMLIAAWHNSSIKRVDLRTMMIEVICGTGARGFGGDNMRAYDAVLDLPVGVALSPSGEMYIADQANQRIRRVDGMDVITTVAGNGMRGFAGDNGPATAAQINNPVGQAAVPAGRIAFDAVGNLFIADTGNHRIRRVDRSGTITTVAGTGNPGTMNETGPATMADLNGPADVEVGPDGTLYIADTLNSCVRAVGSDGMIRTVVGRCGHRGSSGDGGSPTEALFDWPFGLGIDADGNLWVTDTFNHRIRVACIGTAGTYCKAQ